MRITFAKMYVFSLINSGFKTSLDKATFKCYITPLSHLLRIIKKI